MKIPEFSSLTAKTGLSLSEIRIVDPNTIAITSRFPEEEGFDTVYLCLNKESRNTLYKALGIGYKLSKDLYNTAPNNWENLIKTCQMSENYTDMIEDSLIIFDIYESNQGCIYSIIPGDERFISPAEMSNKLKDIEDLIKSYTYKVVSDNSSYKIIIPIDSINNLYAMFELDFAGSSYRMYTAKFLESGIIIPTDKKPIIEVYNLYEFLDSDIRYEINLATKLFNGGGEKDIQEIQDMIPTAKLSLREILNIISWSKFKAGLDEFKFIVKFEDVDEEATDFLITYLNTFGMAYASLKRLSDTRKSLKFSDTRDVNFSEFIKFISSCYCKSTDGAYRVNMGIINYMIDCLRQSDAECIKEELGVEVQDN